MFYLTKLEFLACIWVLLLLTTQPYILKWLLRWSAVSAKTARAPLQVPKKQPCCLIS